MAHLHSFRLSRVIGITHDSLHLAMVDNFILLSVQEKVKGQRDAKFTHQII